MKTLTSLGHAFLAGLATFALVASAHAENLTSADQEFVKSAYQSGIAHLRLAELARDKTSNADVQTFAARLIADHGKANAELKTLAETKGLTLVSGPSTNALAAARELDSRAGADFDKAFAAYEVSHHRRSVQAYEQAGTGTQNSDIRAYVAKTLPTLKERLAAAQSLQDKVGR